MNALTEKNYIEQSLGEMVREKVQLQDEEKERVVEYLLQYREALKLHRRLVVIGRAGRGKTSLLYSSVLTSLEKLERDETAVVPIFTPLKELQRMSNLRDLKGYLDGAVADDVVSRWLWDCVEKGNVNILLDGLDEVSREKRLEFLNSRGILAELVRMLAAPQSRIVLTCRDSVYGELSERLSEIKRAGENEGFIKMELQRFKPEQIIAYALQFFRDEVAAQAFLKDIEDPRGKLSKGTQSSRYTHLAEEPLYLHMLCWLWTGMGDQAEV
jgi:predicted NACHT family NTPase